MGEFVRELRVQTDRRHIMELITDEKLKASERYFQALIARLPNLTDCICDEWMYPGIYRSILETQALRSLDIRWLAFRSSYGKSLTLDFGHLVQCRHLRILKIGSLMMRESQGLAYSVMALKLTTFELSSSKDIEDSQQLDLQKQHRSPLMLFLTHVLNSPQGLPITLEHIILQDQFHLEAPTLWQLTASAIQPCQRLETLAITFYTHKEHFRSLPGVKNYHHDFRLAVHKWSQLEHPAVFQLEYHRLAYGHLKFPHVIDIANRGVLGMASIFHPPLRLSNYDRRFDCTIAFAKDYTVPSDTVMVLPGECDHETFPLVYTKCKNYLERLFQARLSRQHFEIRCLIDRTKEMRLNSPPNEEDEEL